MFFNILFISFLKIHFAYECCASTYVCTDTRLVPVEDKKSYYLAASLVLCALPVLTLVSEVSAKQSTAHC